MWRQRHANSWVPNPSIIEIDLLLTIVSSLCSRDEAATRWILDHGANPNPNVPARVSVLNMPAAHGSINTVKLLLERGADPTKSTALGHAIKRDGDWEEMVKMLLDHSCDINAFCPDGFRGLRGCYSGSVLHAAAAQNLYDRIPFLIDKGADLYKRSETGFTPLELALKYKCEESAAILLEAEKCFCDSLASPHSST